MIDSAWRWRSFCCSARTPTARTPPPSPSRCWRREGFAWHAGGPAPSRGAAGCARCLGSPARGPGRGAGPPRRRPAYLRAARREGCSHASMNSRKVRRWGGGSTSLNSESFRFPGIYFSRESWTQESRLLMLAHPASLWDNPSLRSRHHVRAADGDISRWISSR